MDWQTKEKNDRPKTLEDGRSLELPTAALFNDSKDVWGNGGIVTLLLHLGIIQKYRMKHKSVNTR
jgi:hypothetical protein